MEGTFILPLIDSTWNQYGSFHSGPPDVRTFGRWPMEHAVTDDPKLEEERKLAHDIRKALEAARLPPAAVSELEVMKARAADTVETLMKAVRTFGRWPMEHAVTDDPKL